MMQTPDEYEIAITKVDRRWRWQPKWHWQISDSLGNDDVKHGWEFRERTALEAAEQAVRQDWAIFATPPSAGLPGRTLSRRTRKVRPEHSQGEVVLEETGSASESYNFQPQRMEDIK